MKVEMNTICFEVSDDIGYVLINDPPANKMTIEFLEEFMILVRDYIALAKIKGIIIYGKGRHYSSGADVNQLKEIVGKGCKFDHHQQLASYPIWYAANRTTFDYFYALDIPVISGIRGLCFGSGFELALASHIRICGKGSLMALPESTFGFLPGIAGTLRAVELMGIGQAIDMILSGRTYTADEALELGLIDAVVHKKETLNFCQELMAYILNDEKKYRKSQAHTYVERFNKIKRSEMGGVNHGEKS